MKNLIIFCLVTAFICSSCQKEESVVSLPDPSSDSQLSFMVGRNDFTIKVDGIDREFIVHVPQSYRGDQEIPLLVMLHGSSGNGEKFWNISGWKEKAEEENFLAVFPTAQEYPIAEKQGRLSTKWSSSGLLNAVVAGTEIIDDIPFIYDMIDALESSFALNRARYYISGFSNGGSFVKSRVIVEMPDVFAAASSAAGLGISAVFEPRIAIYSPLYSMLGSTDEKFIEKLKVLGEVPKDANAFLSLQKVSIPVNNCLEMLRLTTEYYELNDLPKSNTLVYGHSTVNQPTEYRIQIIDGLEHNYPNGKNNPHGLSAPDILWPWFMRFENTAE